MKRQFYRKGRQQVREENLTAAYNLLNGLSDDEFESWVEQDNVSPSKYEESANRFLAQPIGEKIADLKRMATARNRSSSAPAAWLEKAMAELPNLARVVWFKIVSFAEIADETNVESASALSATAVKPRREKSVRLPSALQQRLPWAGDKLRIKAKQSQEDAQKNSFLVSLEIQQRASRADELGVAIKFKSDERPLVIFLKPNESSKPIGVWPDELQDLEIQLFLPRCE